MESRAGPALEANTALPRFISKHQPNRSLPPACTTKQPNPQMWPGNGNGEQGNMQGRREEREISATETLVARYGCAGQWLPRDPESLKCKQMNANLIIELN